MPSRCTTTGDHSCPVQACQLSGGWSGWIPVPVAVAVTVSRIAAPASESAKPRFRASPSAAGAEPKHSTAIPERSRGSRSWAGTSLGGSATVPRTWVSRGGLIARSCTVLNTTAGPDPDPVATWLPAATCTS